MKNLVAELDLLQAQLNKIKELNHSSKLYKTKFIIEKSQIDEDPEALEEKVQNLKQELANRKLHHCTKQIGRQIKTFKKTEPLKIKKRVKNSTAKKKEALESELDLVKNLVIDEWAEYVSKAQLSKYFSSLLGFEKRSMSKAENNVYGRICKLVSVRDAVSAAIKAIGQYYTPENLPEEKVVSVESNEEVKDTTDKDHEADANKIEKQEKKDKKDSKSASKEGDEEEEEEEEDSFNDDFLALPDASMDSDGDMAMGDSGDEKPVEDDFFVAPSGGALPELAAGYISGSEDESEPEVLKPERKNRRGQRARRAIWEKRYGRAAKHVVQERQEQQKKFEERQKKREFKVQKESQRQEAAKARLERKKELEAKPLHPSWVAKLQQEKLKSVKPAGKKIVFD